MTTSTSPNNFQDQSSKFASNLDRREAIGKVFEWLFLFGLLISFFVLALLLFDVGKDGLARFFPLALSPKRPHAFLTKAAFVQRSLGARY